MSVLCYFILLFTDLFYNSLFEGLRVKAEGQVRQTIYSMLFFSPAIIIWEERQNKCNDSQKISKMSHVSSTPVMTSLEEPHL